MQRGGEEGADTLAWVLVACALYWWVPRFNVEWVLTRAGSGFMMSCFASQVSCFLLLFQCALSLSAALGPVARYFIQWV